MAHRPQSSGRYNLRRSKLEPDLPKRNNSHDAAGLFGELESLTDIESDLPKCNPPSQRRQSLR